MSEIPNPDLDPDVKGYLKLPDLLPERINLETPKWIKIPNSTVAQAAQAFLRQREKQQKIINLEYPPKQDGIFLLPRWRKYNLVKIGQRKGPENLTTRGGSAHGVVFCTAEVRTPLGQISELNVALKPFQQARDATHEATMNALVLQRGFVSTDPICVVMDNEKGYVITSLRTNAITLDQEPWHRIHLGDEVIVEFFNKRLRQIAELLAEYHAKGIHHSDTQLKNFWVVDTYDEEGRIEGIDWEAAHISKIIPPPTDELLKMGSDDLRVLFNSLNGNYTDSKFEVFLGSPNYKWQEFYRTVYYPYESHLMKLIPDSEDYLDSASQIVDNIKRELNIT